MIMGNEVSNSTIRNPNSPLPAGWRWVRLGEVIEDTQPGFACGKRAGDDGVIQLRMNNISIRGQIDLSSIIRIPATPEQIKKYRLLPGDIVFNNTNSVELVGKTALFYEEKGVFLYSNHLTRLRPKTEILAPVYLTLWLQLHWHQRLFEHICDRWIGQAAVHLEKLLALEFPLPPLPEQKRIAAKVQELMAEVERARTACEKRLEATKALPSAYLHQVFESDEAKKWERRKLGEALELHDNGLWGFQDLVNGIPVIRSTNFENNGYISTDDITRVQPNIQNIENKKLQKGDILLERSGGGPKQPVGRVVLFDLEGEFYFGNFISRLRCKGDIESRFLFLYLFYLHLKGVTLNFQDQTTGIRNLRFGEYLQLLIPISNLTAQQRIAAEFKDKMAYAEKLKASIEKQLDVIKALPQAILRRAFSGEL